MGGLHARDRGKEAHTSLLEETVDAHAHMPQLWNMRDRLPRALREDRGGGDQPPERR